MIEAVVLDVGETVIDETRIWQRWADRLGVTRLTMMGVVGALAADDQPHREVFEIVAPGLDVESEIQRWRHDDPIGLRENFDEEDLYPDVRPALHALRTAGVKVWLAGNQPQQARAALEAMRLEVDGIITSGELGVEKPSLDFFREIVRCTARPTERVLYVGDRVDNDVLPAHEAGLRTVLLRRGPWGHLHARRPDATVADAVCDSLMEIRPLIDRF